MADKYGAWNDPYGALEEQDQQAAVAQGAVQGPLTEQEKHDASANVYASGASLGSLGDIYTGNPKLQQPAYLRPDQTGAERIAEQQSNFLYGGYEGGAQYAVNEARENVGQYSDALSGYGDQFLGQATAGQQSYGYGTAGVYGTAGELIDYAQQGPGPSVAQAQHDANTAQAMRQQLALAGSGRGQGGGASAFRQAAANQAMISGLANAQTMALQAQEAQDWRQAQLAAYGQAGALYGQGAGLGAEYATGMSELASGAQQAGGQLTLGQEQLANQINTTALTGTQAYEQNLTDIYGIDKGIPKSADQGLTTKEMIGLGLSAAGTAAMFASDIRAKTNIAPASSLGALDHVIGVNSSGAEDKAALDRKNRFRAGGQNLLDYGQSLFMSSDVRNKENIAPASALESIEDAGTYSYDYLNPERHGEGRFIGPMAQDLEKAPGVVHTAPDGAKSVDPGRLTMVNTGAIAELNQKVEALAEQTAPQTAAPAKPKGKGKAKAKAAKPRYEVEIGEAQIEGQGSPVEFGPAEIEYGPPLPPAEAPPPPAVAKPAAPAAPKAAASAAPRAKPLRLAPERVQPPWPGEPVWEWSDGTYQALPESDPTPARRFIEERGKDLRRIFDPEGYDRDYEQRRRVIELEQKERMGLPTDRPIVYSGDPSRLEFEAQKYGTPAFGAPGPAEAPAELGPSLMDRVFGPNLGDYASEVAEEEYRNEALRQHWRNPPREDLYL